CARPLERVDPEEQLHEVIVDREVGSLDDEDVAPSDVFEHADEDVPFAEDHRLGARDLGAELGADGLGELLARPAGENLELAEWVVLLGGAESHERFIHVPVISSKTPKGPREQLSNRPRGPWITTAAIGACRSAQEFSTS